MINLIGQMFGGIAVLLGFLTYQEKSSEKLLLIQTATILVFRIHYILIGAISAFALNAVGLVRNSVYANHDKKIFSHKALPYIFAVIMLVMGIFSWQNIYSVFVILGLVINTVALSFKNAQNIRKSILVSSPLVLIYDIYSGSIGGSIYESVVIISSIIGIVRFRNGKDIKNV